MTRMDWPDKLNQVAENGELTPKSLRRADVVEAFHQAFQQIGGVPRLSLWADGNPTEFYKLFARLLPSAASDELNGATRVLIVHALPRPNYDPAAQAIDVTPKVADPV